MAIALIADIVGSRSLEDRVTAQQGIDDALARVERALPVGGTPLQPVVGDELEGLYERLEDVLAATLLFRLAWPDGVDCRFGIGIGAVSTIPAAAGALTDGPGWWAARRAIEYVAALQRRQVPAARAWVSADQDEDAPALRIVNAALLTRDQLIDAMSPRARRLAFGRCIGETQRDLARTEGITQSAVSQILATAGAAALVAAFEQLRG